MPIWAVEGKTLDQLLESFLHEEINIVDAERIQ